VKNKVILFDGEVIKKEVHTMWEEVTSNTNSVIANAETYGFSLIEVILDPDIDQMLTALRGIEGILDVIIDRGFFNEMEYDETRLVLNARESIRKMEYVAIALKENNEVEFEKAVKDLKLQVSF